MREIVYKYLNIVTWNICGLKEYDGDLNVNSYIHTFDIIGLVETWEDDLFVILGE